MSGKTTLVCFTDGPGITLHGHVDRDEAIAAARSHYEQLLAEACSRLAALNAGNVEVLHQRANTATATATTSATAVRRRSPA